MEIEDVPEAARPAREEHSEGGGNRLWLIVALMLLLLLLSCCLLQLLFPAVRGTANKETVNGLTSVFGVYGLHQPLGVAAGPGGEIAVSDTGVQSLLLYDKNGAFTRRLGGSKPSNKVFSVDGLVFHRGRLYVCDWVLRRIWIFDLDGTARGWFPRDAMSPKYGTEGFSPYDLAVLDDDFLVTSREGVFRFDGATRKLKGRFDKKAPDGIGVRFPNGIAVDAKSGTVYVCDVLNRRLVAFGRDGNPRWFVGKPDSGGRIRSLFGLPRGVAVTDGGVLVSDTFHHTLYLFSRSGKLLGWYGSRGVADGMLNFPEALDVAPDGLVYLADRENDRIQVLKLNKPLPADKATQKKWRRNFVDLGD
ncbi:MAG: hypothetical protein C4521_07300 [Actinobacteria bacterium]|nr:MAG: hypothetical protein C4521_07300 [Actinomycetota bacterium]